jgi:hypothetical protein
MSAKLSWSRWAVIVIAVLFAVIGVLPTVVGSKWVYEPLLKRFEAGDFQLSVEAVRLGWFSPTSLRGIELSDSQGQHLLSIREIRNDRGLLSSLLSGRQLGQLVIDEPKLDIELLTDGSNLERLTDALKGSPNNSESRNSAPPTIDIDILLKSASVRVIKKEQPTISDELVVVPPFDLHVTYRALKENPRLDVEPTTILDHVKLTPELIQLGLDRAVPLLAKSAWFDGSISFKTGKIEVPLAEPQNSHGLAAISFHEVRSGPSDIKVLEVLNFIATLRGQSAAHEFVVVDGSTLEIQVADQRVSHRGLELGLPRIDSRLQVTSSGSVGLVDRKLDLALEIPIPIEQLARRDEVRALGVPTLTVPIRGNLDEPRVDWTAMRSEGANILGQIRERLSDEAPKTAATIGTLEELAGGGADEAIAVAIEVFRRLNEARHEKKASSNKESSDGDILPDAKPGAQDEHPKQEESDRPILDALRKVLRGEPNP